MFGVSYFNLKFAGKLNPAFASFITVPMLVAATAAAGRMF